MKFSVEQQRSIDARGHNILVSASAGSGKTTVLTSRILQRVYEGLNINELLVVTFTDAAALEMKDRLRHKLYDVIQTQTLNGITLTQEEIHHFERQLLNLSKMMIGTIDSFCNTVVKEYYYLLEDSPLDANPMLLSDETEVMMLKEEAVEYVRNLYLHGEYNHEVMSEDEKTRRDDMMFLMQQTDDDLTEVISIIDRIRALPHPLSYLDDVLSQTPKTTADYLQKLSVRLSNLIAHYKEAYDHAPTIDDVFDDIEEYVMTHEAKECPGAIKTEAKRNQAKETLANDDTQLHMLFELADPILNQAYSDDEALINAWKQLIQHEAEWNISHNSGIYHSSSRKKLASSALNDWNELTKKGNKDRKALHDFFGSILLSGDYDIQWICTQNARLARVLVDVTKAVLAKYQQLKHERGYIDFADLEHNAYELLQHDEVANYYQSTFKEIMIDEYQDVNQLQNAIMETMSNHNLFMVGDVKQSIYGFRYADSDLFMSKYNDYTENPVSNDEDELIILAENYRSRRSILDYTNQAFLRLMDHHIGSIDYDDKEQLRCGLMNQEEYIEGSYEGHDPAIEWFYYDTHDEHQLSFEEHQQLLTLIQHDKYGYILQMAAQIQSLMAEQTLICDQGKERPLTYRDIAIIVSSRTDFEQIETIFNACHIPLVLDKNKNYFKTTEVSHVLAYLMVIDNPYQDIPLVSVLRSPFVGLDEEELAQIRLMQRDDSFYEALLSYNEHHQNEPIATFLSQLTTYRDMSHQVSVADLIWQIYQDTHIDDYVAGLKNGAQRHAHLHALYHRAEQYEQNGHKGLYSFIQYMHYMQKKDYDIEGIPQMPDDETGAVQVMTIHQSKGLEYPYVFFVDRPFQRSTSHIIIDDNDGFVFKSLSDDFYKIDNPQKYSPQYREKQKEYAENMRELYVALTRAKEGLFIFQNTPSDRAKDEHTITLDGYRLTEKTRMEATSYGIWLDDCFSNLSQSPLPQSLTYQPMMPTIHHHDYTLDDVYAQYHLMEKALSTKHVTIEHETTYAGKAKEAFAYLNHDYDYIAATQTPNYASVSEIKTRLTDMEFSALTKEVTVHDQWATPSFADSSAISAANIGTLTHLMMEKLPTHHQPTLEEIHEQITAEIDKGTLTKEEAQQLPVEGMMAFYHTDLGKLMISEHSTVYKEQPFSMVVNHQEEQVLIHGIIDGFIIHGDTIELFDYKTNQRRYLESTVDFIARMKETYRVQMEQYKQALQSSYPNKMIRTSLYLFAIEQCVAMDND